MKNRKIAIVGGGQMGRALVGGMMASGFTTADKITVIDPSEESRAWWTKTHPAVTTGKEISHRIQDADVILLAVKPNIIAQVGMQVGEFCDDVKLVISIAAGVSLKSVCDKVEHQRVVRVMPNTPSLVGAGASAFCVADAVSEKDCQWIEAALAGVGIVVQVAETQMDAVTGLSGSGPAYICLVIEALADGGVLTGLPRPLAMKLATQTVLGTAKMVMETKRHPGELKDAVASPGGTTIAALKVLEEKGLRAALINAVQASADRSKAIG